MIKPLFPEMQYPTERDFRENPTACVELHENEIIEQPVQYPPGEFKKIALDLAQAIWTS